MFCNSESRFFHQPQTSKYKDFALPFIFNREVNIQKPNNSYEKLNNIATNYTIHLKYGTYGTSSIIKTLIDMKVSK